MAIPVSNSTWFWNIRGTALFGGECAWGPSGRSRLLPPIIWICYKQAFVGRSE